MYHRRVSVSRETRARILDAARDAVVARGYHGAGLEAVAAAAGITRVTVYRHFGNKAGLLTGLAERIAERSQVVGRAGEAHAADDPVEALNGLVAALCRLWSEDPPLMRRLIGLAAVDPDVAPVIEEREAWRQEQVRLCVDRLADAGRLRTDRTRLTATAAACAATRFEFADEIATVRRVDHHETRDLLQRITTAAVTA